MIIPKALRPGDTIAIIGISGCIGDDARAKAEMAAEKVRALGFRVKLDPTAWAEYGYLAGTDQERADALNRAFADPEVDAIWIVRGGYGVARMLDRVDFDLIRRHPKAVIGYSDITAIQMALLKECGLGSFHGPMPKTDVLDDPNGASLLHALMGEPDVEMKNFDGTPLTAIHPGAGEGILTGGNLCLVTSLCGTPWQVETRGRILFLEEVGEATYAVDRYLTQLRLSGLLDGCAGVVFGAFTKCFDDRPGHSLSIEEIIRDVLAGVRCPVVMGLQAGHIPEKMTLPIGRRVRLDADAGTLTLLP